MGINVNVSTATTPGLLEVEQPDVTGSWDHPMVMLECVWGFSNQLTYGDYNEVTIGGYIDVCFGVLLEVVLGATVEIVSPLAVEVILPIPGLQPLLRFLGTKPAMAAAKAAGWAGRTSGQGGDKPGLQYDVVFGNYVESVSELKFKQHSGDKFDSEWVKTHVATSHSFYFPAVDHVECIGIEGDTGARTLVSSSSILLTAPAGPFSVLSGEVNIASTAANVVLSATAGVVACANGGLVQLSATGNLSLAADGAQALIAAGEVKISADSLVLSSGDPVKAGGPPLVVAPASLAAGIILQAEAAAAAATAWAASAASEMAAAESWQFRFPE